MSHYDDIYLHDTAREDSEAEQERIDKRLAELLADRDAVLEADCDAGDDLRRWCDVRTEIQTALADLARTDPSDLLGSDVLTRLYWLAAGRGAARMEKLKEQAESDVAEAAAFRPDMGEAA